MREPFNPCLDARPRPKVAETVEPLSEDFRFADFNQRQECSRKATTCQLFARRSDLSSADSTQRRRKQNP